MTDPLAVAPADPRVTALLTEAGFGDAVFNPRQHRGCELVDRYVVHVALDLLHELQLVPLLAAPTTADALLAARGFVAGFRPALAWLLGWLTDAGILVREGARYSLPGATPPSARTAIREAGLATDPSYAPAYALLDEAAAIAPRVARGEITAERALFQKVALWAAYFDNRHAYYALNNHVTAHAAATRLGAGAVVEVGAGMGSATQALFDLLAARGALGALASYTFTEPVPFFRRRAQRALGTAYPGVPLSFAALDVNAPWAAQGVGPGSATLVWGVNVFHLARRLPEVLRAAHDTLVPGGWLVAGEGIRPAPGRPVAPEFPFQLLESFVDVELDPEIRPAAGFLTAEQWQAAFTRAGFVDVGFHPDAVRLRALSPRFHAAAVCGRRPA